MIRTRQNWRQKPPLGVPINWGHPDAQGMRACILFNERSGNEVTDMVSGSRGVGESLVWSPGNDGICRSAGYVKLPWTGMGTQGTLEALGTTGAGSGTFLYDSNPRYLLWWSGNSKFEGYINGVDLSGTQTLVAGTEYHTVLTWRPGYRGLWINGIQDGTDAGSPTPGVCTEMVVGARYTYGSAWNGNLSLWRCYDAFKSPGEIANLYAQPYAMFGRQRVWALGAALTWRRRVIVAVPV